MDNLSIRRIAGLFMATRIVNSCAVFLAVAAGGFLAAGGRIVPGEFGTIAVAATSLAFLAAFGYALNDYYDVRADEVNKPSRPIPSGALSRRSVLVVAVVCAFVAALMALRARPAIEGALAVVFGLVWVYSAWVKRTGFPGNVLVGLLASATLVIGGLTVGNLKPVLFPALLAFLANLPREILKDLEDLEGDKATSARSVASAGGERFALRLASTLMITLVVASLAPCRAGLYNRYYFAVVVLLDALLIWEAFLMWRVRSPRDAIEKREIKTAVRVLKLTMLAGLLAICVGSL